jgi:hypothetical protein
MLNIHVQPEPVFILAGELWFMNHSVENLWAVWPGLSVSEAPA